MKGELSAPNVLFLAQCLAPVNTPFLGYWTGSCGQFLETSPNNGVPNGLGPNLSWRHYEKTGGLTAIVVFGLVWTAFVGAFDCFTGYNLYRQARSTGFAQTTGIVTSSEVTRHSGSKGRKTYGVDIRCTYEVNGSKFSSDRYRYGAGSSSDSQWAYYAVAKNRVGTEVPVFFNPRDPGDALLNPGVNGSDMFMLLFLTPFNMIMLGLWSAAAGVLLRKFCKTKAGGVKWSTGGRSIRVRLPRFSPVIAGLAATGVGSFASIFVIGFTAGFHPGATLALFTWLALIGAGVGVAVWQWRKQSDGNADLVINQLENSVELPVAFGHRQR